MHWEFENTAWGKKELFFIVDLIGGNNKICLVQRRSKKTASLVHQGDDKKPGTLLAKWRHIFLVVGLLKGGGAPLPLRKKQPF